MIVVNILYTLNSACMINNVYINKKKKKKKIVNNYQALAKFIWTVKNIRNKT